MKDLLDKVFEAFSDHFQPMDEEEKEVVRAEKAKKAAEELKMYNEFLGEDPDEFDIDEVTSAFGEMLRDEAADLSDSDALEIYKILLGLDIQTEIGEYLSSFDVDERYSILSDLRDGAPLLNILTRLFV